MEMRFSLCAPRWIATSAALFLSVWEVAAVRGAETLSEVEPAVPAGPESTELEPLTWSMLVGVVDRHPAVRAAEQEGEAAAAGVRAAGAVPLPELSASAAYGVSADGAESDVEWGVALSMPFDWSVQRGAKQNAARAAFAVRNAEVAAVRRQVLQQLRSLFWELVEAQERVRALVELKAQSEALLETVARRVALGETRPVESLRVGIELERIAGDLETAQILLEGHRARLVTWLDGGHTGAVRVAANLEALPSPPALEDAIDAAESLSPQLGIARARGQSREAKLALERRLRVPPLSAGFFFEQELDKRSTGGSVQMAVPLWNWNRGEIERAEHLVSAETWTGEVERRTLVQEVIAAHAQCRAAVARAVRYRDRILPEAEEAARTVARTYEIGEAPLADLLDSRRTAVSTRGAYLAASAAAQTDCSRLDMLMGKE